MRTTKNKQKKHSRNFFLISRNELVFFEMFFSSPEIDCFFPKIGNNLMRTLSRKKHMFFWNARPKSNVRAHLKQRKNIYSGLICGQPPPGKHPGPEITKQCSTYFQFQNPVFRPTLTHTVTESRLTHCPSPIWQSLNSHNVAVILSQCLYQQPDNESYRRMSRSKIDEKTLTLIFCGK